MDLPWLQNWLFPLLGIVLSAAGVVVSWMAYREAASARQAANAARDAAIRAQQELTVHRELLPQVERLDTLLKSLVEAATTAAENTTVLNEVIDQLSKASHASTALQKQEVGGLLDSARTTLSGGTLTREMALEARNYVNEAVAKLRFDSEPVRALVGGA